MPKTQDSPQGDMTGRTGADADEIERVGRAIADEIGDWYEAGPDTYDALARAAIKALRAGQPPADNRRFNKPAR